MLAQLCFVLIFAPVFTTISHAQDTETEPGDLIFIISDNVSPNNIAEYEQWIKEFKALADATGAPNYGVGQNNEGMSFYMNAGKTWADFGEMEKKFGQWFSENPKAIALNKKYEHTRNYSQTSLWRHNPLQTYAPEGYDNSVERKYTRVGSNWIKSGQEEKANEIIAEYKAAWTEAGISESTRTYWNIFGEEQSCVAFVTSYESREAWVNSRKEILEKVGEAKLNELRNKWSSILRKEEESESTDRPDLSHWEQ